MTRELTSAEAVGGAVFWCCAAGIVYAYLGYPALVYVLSRVFGRVERPPVGGPLPRVTLLIAAYNEAAVLERRIENALALDYPRELLEIVIASDGSDDATAEICGRYEGRVRAMLFPERRGKAGTLKAALAGIDSEIVALSDANTEMEGGALRALAAWFADPTVGAVCGRLVLRDAAGGANADGLYWRYETFLKECEGRLGALLGANGAIYAIRRGILPVLPPGTVVDDFVIPLLARLRSGRRIVYEPGAVAHEETAPDLRSEFGRRARIGVGAWQALTVLWPLLNPRHGWTAFALWSHKVMRWVCPFMLIGALVASVALARHPLYAGALLVQGAFYALGLLGAVAAPASLGLRRLRVCAMFITMNAALLTGFLRWLRGGHSGVWRRTARE